MEVILAKTAGFCFGVERAVNMVHEQVEKGVSPLYTYGPIVHNEQVVADFETKGVSVISSPEELSAITEGTVVVRAHGVGPDVYEIIARNHLTLIDATCPFVKKIHRIVEEKSAEGYTIVIAGDASHPEVQGIMGWCKNSRVIVVNSIEETENFQNPNGEKLCLVSQTTFNAKKFELFVEVFKKKSYTCIVVNTICNATDERQKEACEIASKADVMIVIGGRSSSNTRKLYEICKDECDDTYYIQTLEDFVFERGRQVSTVGITAGASTPKNIIEEVQNYVRNEF